MKALAGTEFVNLKATAPARKRTWVLELKPQKNGSPFALYSGRGGWGVRGKVMRVRGKVAWEALKLAISTQDAILLVAQLFEPPHPQPFSPGVPSGEGSQLDEGVGRRRVR